MATPVPAAPTVPVGSQRQATVRRVPERTIAPLPPQFGQHGTARFRTVVMPVAPVVRCPPPPGLMGHQEAVPKTWVKLCEDSGEEPGSVTRSPLHLRVERDDDGGTSQRRHGSGGGGQPHQDSSGGHGHGGSDSDARQQSNSLAPQALMGPSRPVDAGPEQNFSHAQAQVIVTALREAGNGVGGSVAVMRELAVHLRCGEARDALRSLAAVRQLLVAAGRIDGPPPPLDSPAARRAALLPLQLLACATPRTPAGLALAAERLSGAARACNAATRQAQ